ncbi:MAG: VWA domain-containing protein [Halapricum sp.]
MTVLEDHLRTELVTFVARLREAGVAMPGDGSIAAAEAIAALSRRDRERVRAALGATLCRRPADRETLDRIFPVFWARLQGDDESYPEPADSPATLRAGAGAIADTPVEADTELGSPGEGVSGGSVPESSAEKGVDASGTDYSPDGRSRRISIDGVDHVDVADTVETLTRAVATRQGRRWAAGAGEADVRRALRVGVSQGGVPLDLPERRRERTAARGIVVVDVSESVLDAVDRDFLLSVLYEIRQSWRRTPVLFFDTELRDVSPAFDEPTSEDVIEALVGMGVEWGGGTRLTDALAALRTSRPAAVDRRGTALVVSDGLERGDVTELRAELAWLARRVGTVLWFNPLASDPQWTPSAPGMQAAFPFLDGLYPFADATDLRRAAEELTRYGPERRTVPSVG